MIRLKGNKIKTNNRAFYLWPWLASDLLPSPLHDSWRWYCWLLQIFKIKSSFKPIFDDAEAEMQTRGVLASLAYISRSKRLEEFNYLSSSIDEISWSYKSVSTFKRGARLGQTARQAGLWEARLKKNSIACSFWFSLLHNSSNRLQQNDFIAGMDVVKCSLMFFGVQFE